MVYKLVPGLFSHEMKMRRDFYEMKPYAGEPIFIMDVHFGLPHALYHRCTYAHYVAVLATLMLFQVVIGDNETAFMAQTILICHNGQMSANYSHPVNQSLISGRSSPPTSVGARPSDGYRSNGQFMSCLSGRTLQNGGH